MLNQKYKNNIAVITSNYGQYTYSDLFEYLDLIEKLVESRSLVFCLSKNSFGSLLGYISFITKKSVPMMLDYNINELMLASLIGVYKPRYIWCPSERLFNNKDYLKKKCIKDYDLYESRNKSFFLLHKNLALLLTTSGSTGSPKFVKLTYDNLYSNSLSIINYLSIKQKDRPITTLPMHYSFGLSIINSHIMSGATILLTNKSLMEKEFWTFIKSQKATSISGVPYTFEILKKLRFFKQSLPSLKVITQAGGKLNKVLNREFATFSIENGINFYVMYGQTEATARISYLPPRYSIKKLGSIGKPIPDGEISLIDEDGNIIDEQDKEGEIVYSGPNVSMGYAECGIDLIKDDVNQGKLYTGDIAKRDNNGFYYIIGRKKRFIKIFGNRINLDEVEKLVKDSFCECACIGFDDKMSIFAVEKKSIKLIKDFIKDQIGINQNVFDVHYIKNIPKNSSGKTLYSELIELL